MWVRLPVLRLLPLSMFSLCEWLTTLHVRFVVFKLYNSHHSCVQHLCAESPYCGAPTTTPHTVTGDYRTTTLSMMLV